MSEPAPAAIVAGYQVGNYRLQRRIGAGAMGEVWLAHHELLERPAAVKLMKPGLAAAGDDAPIQRFLREARATGSLESPNTVRLYDFGVTPQGVFYYVMERLRGVDLYRLVLEDGPLEPARAIHFVDQACGALAEAHGVGLVHRDVKPANIHACELGIDADVVKVLDFGLVRDLGNRDVDITGGRMIGSPAFVSPEGCRGESDPRGDLYSLGCTLYFLLTSRFVFDAETLVDMVDAHLHQPARPPSRAAPWPLPPGLDELVLELLEKDVARRPASAREVRQRLRAIPLEEPWTHALAEQWWELNRARFAPPAAERSDPEEEATHVVALDGA
ncbi:MAG: serine/threonine-protein kinase [Planctomycetota bacterium]